MIPVLFITSLYVLEDSSLSLFPVFSLTHKYEDKREIFLKPDGVKKIGQLFKEKGDKS